MTEVQVGGMRIDSSKSSLPTDKYSLSIALSLSVVLVSLRSEVLRDCGLIDESDSVPNHVTAVFPAEKLVGGMTCCAIDLDVYVYPL
jgi:hypothetical protein